MAPSAEAQSRLTAAKKLLDEKATETAALAFDPILREPSLRPVHDEARYQLGKSLARLGLHHSALTTFDEILEKGPQASRFYGARWSGSSTWGGGSTTSSPVLARVARHARDGVPPDYQDRFHFLLAKYEFERGRALEDAGRAAGGAGGLGRGAPAGRAGPRAGRGGLAGRSRARRRTRPRATSSPGALRRRPGALRLRRRRSATERFKEVVRLTNPKHGRAADPELREQAFLQLARIHYQHRQNRYAIFYYGKMPWGGENWLEGLWEASYAHYRIGEHEKTLGNLLTLQSPYFKDEYYPESWILKAIIYYENCRYPEARLGPRELQLGIYEPLYDELVRLTATPRPARPTSLEQATIASAA